VAESLTRTLLDFVDVNKVANFNRKGRKVIAQRTQSNEYQNSTIMYFVSNLVTFVVK
jgi:hypothetical protein